MMNPEFDNLRLSQIAKIIEQDMEKAHIWLTPELALSTINRFIGYYRSCVTTKVVGTTYRIGVYANVYYGKLPPECEKLPFNEHPLDIQLGIVLDALCKDPNKLSEVVEFIRLREDKRFFVSRGTGSLLSDAHYISMHLE
jgi:hypothetical protein